MDNSNEVLVDRDVLRCPRCCAELSLDVLAEIIGSTTTMTEPDELDVYGMSCHFCNSAVTITELDFYHALAWKPPKEPKFNPASNPAGLRLVI